MKINITFKTPDTVERAISEALGDLKLHGARCSLDDQSDCDYCQNDREEELETIQGERNKAEELIGKFVQHGEVVTIEFDTDTGTAKVVEV